MQSIHNCPVFLINHKRFLFCLQLVLGWLTMASQSSYIKHRPFLTLAFCWGMLLSASRPKRPHCACAAPGRGEAGDLSCTVWLIFIWCLHSRAKSDPDSKARFLNSEYCCPHFFPSLTSVFPSSFFLLRLFKTIEFPKRRSGYHVSYSSVFSMVPFYDNKRMSPEEKTVSVFYPSSSP